MQESKDPVETPAMDQISRHDHVCLIYQEEAEILNPVIPFIQKGISLGQRCLYLNAGEETLERVLNKAVLGQKHDIGALVLLPLQETWLKGGSFDAARAIELLQTFVTGAAADGFKGCRIICDMGWAGNDRQKAALLPDFELCLNRFTAENEVSVLCLYRRQLFDPGQMLQLAKLHPRLIISAKVCSNPFFITADREPDALRESRELEMFLGFVQKSTTETAERDKLRQELEQAYGALARKIYENWQEEDTLKASEKEIQEKDEALLAHRRRLQTILQHLPTILMAFDTGDRLAACNHEFERVTGYKAEEVMGKAMLELIQVDEGRQAEVVSAHPAEGGHYRGMEWNLGCKDGSLKSISWSNISKYIPITGWSNWIMGLDETPRVHAERGLRSLTDELDARNADLEAFGYAVSHDLSGQLTKISSHCAMMRERYSMALSPQCQELLHSIHESTQEMAGRIRALQRFTSLVPGQLDPEEVNLSAMASEIAADLKGAAGERAVTFEIEDGVTAKGDRKLLRLAMEQLLENAWNYTAGVKDPVIHFGTAEVGGERSFYVSDNGPRPEADVVAPPPRRTDRADHLCCGIGLATVQRIINLHRGRIWAADDAGRGGTLFFTV
jgi:PAS domain S-box-containing protein